jgi:hypothetical protein
MRAKENEHLVIFFFPLSLKVTVIAFNCSQMKPHWVLSNTERTNAFLKLSVACEMVPALDRRFVQVLVSSDGGTVTFRFGEDQEQVQWLLLDFTTGKHRAQPANGIFAFLPSYFQEFFLMCRSTPTVDDYAFTYDLLVSHFRAKEELAQEIAKIKTDIKTDMSILKGRCYDLAMALNTLRDQKRARPDDDNNEEIPPKKRARTDGDGPALVSE